MTGVVSAHDGNYDGYSAAWVWWLEHGLDGIAGGLIAVVGVAVTLWYDRSARVRELHQRDSDEDRQAVREILARAVDAQLALQALDSSDTRRAEAVRAVEREIKLAAPRLHRAAGLGSNLQMVGAILGLAQRKEYTRTDVSRLVSSTMRRCESWLRNPVTYNDGLFDQAETNEWGTTAIGGLLYGWPEDHEALGPEVGDL